ncbi:Fe2OG dioxygenase domain-containing protein [Pseudoscourfieldia marina]
MRNRKPASSAASASASRCGLSRYSGHRHRLGGGGGGGGRRSLRPGSGCVRNVVCAHSHSNAKNFNNASPNNKNESSSSSSSASSSSSSSSSSSKVSSKDSLEGGFAKPNDDNIDADTQRILSKALAGQGGTGLIEARLAKRNAAAKTKVSASPTAPTQAPGAIAAAHFNVMPPARLPSAGALTAVDELDEEERSFLHNTLEEYHVDVDLEYPGATCVCLDPPVLLFPEFYPQEECVALAASAADSGLMQQSGLGEGHAQSASTSARRTSRTMLVDSASPADMRDLATSLQERVEELLVGVSAWGTPGKAPSNARQHSFEPLQVCAYAENQQFKAHEDAFPDSYAMQCGFNRSATALLYLNDAGGDASAGGSTSFLSLGVGDEIRITPSAGSLLLFFPSRRGTGAPSPSWRADDRTLHCAYPTDGSWEKWVAQQWIAVGV